jgi:hypothetical protein
MLLHGLPVGPVRNTDPARTDVDTELPTITHASIPVQDTPISDADEAATGRLDQLPPPFPVVRITPRPLRVVSRVVEVVPTRVQSAPATPAGVGAVGAVGAAPLGADTPGGVAVVPTWAAVGREVVAGRAVFPPPELRQEIPSR